jgi:16S rRNA G966 N2-methylase RsmD
MGRKRKSADSGGRLFMIDGQPRMFDKSLEQTLMESKEVECLGRTFPNDDARRTFFLEHLGEKLKDPEFRKLEGFPLGDDEDILALSDPPYYTACPNPFIEDFIRHCGKPYFPKVPYHREPFAVDVSEGKTHPLYTAHSYFTKVPHQAIMRAILHYTDPGDVVLDGFAGSGMTGVAAQLCGSPEPDFKDQLEEEWKSAGLGSVPWGCRRVILDDLDPAATFIAANYNLPFDVDAFHHEAQVILDQLETELGWMYETTHKGGNSKGRINYTVWSEVFACPECGTEIVFLEQALDKKSKRVRDTFPCPACSAELTKDNLQRLMETFIDPATGKPWQRVRFVPLFINYAVGGKKYQKKADDADLRLLKRIAELPLPSSVPTDMFPIAKMYHGSRLAPKGFTRVHRLFLPRATQALGNLWTKAKAVENPRLRNMMLFFVEQALWTASLLNRYRPTGYSQVNQYLTGVYYIASQHAECSPWYILEGKLRRLMSTFRQQGAKSNHCLITTGTAAALGLPSQSIDYVFTDPPFGENIPYADLNFLVESWHHVKTDAQSEAIVDAPKDKGLSEYQHLMQRCFEEYFRVLKPGRWMTVVFHNSQNRVWNAIQEAMSAAGFVVADVRTLDKKQGSYRQVTSTAMKEDLVISAYKPNDGLEQRFGIAAGTEEGAWDFVRTHLGQLPRFLLKNGQAEVIVERTSFRIFDRLVAFHVRRGVGLPLSAAQFYAGLDQRGFPCRNEMYFLPDQVAEYEKRLMTARGVVQAELFVVDEESAIQWIRRQLTEKPQTLQSLTPKFLKEITLSKNERPLELRELLSQGFLCYDGNGDVPNQIHKYLSSNFKELRNLPKDHVALRAKAAERWYVPDPNKAADLEKLRERGLLREFEEYRGSAQKRLKSFRLEAIRAGFKKAWENKDYDTIITVAQMIPDDVLQEDPKLLMYYDQALTRKEG